MRFIGVEVEQETSAPPPKKNTGSAPDCLGHRVQNVPEKLHCLGCISKQTMRSVVKKTRLNTRRKISWWKASLSPRKESWALFWSFSFHFLSFSDVFYTLKCRTLVLNHLHGDRAARFPNMVKVNIHEHWTRFNPLWVSAITHKRFVIFTCRSFKINGNTAALSQSNCRNFSCSSIKPGRPNKLAGNKRFIMWPKREFSCGATLRISSGEDRPRTIRDNTDPFFNANLPNCPFSSPEPLGLICSKPRDQETTGYGDQNGNCHVKQLAYLRLLRHFSVKQTVRCLISFPK